MTDFDERWLKPGGVVPVDIPTTGALIREIQRLRATPSAIAATETQSRLDQFAEIYESGFRSAAKSQQFNMPGVDGVAHRLGLLAVVEACEKPSTQTGNTPLDASMDNVLAWRIGEAAREAAKEPAGDLIDSGLALAKHLRAKGFDIVSAIREQGEKHV